MSMNYDVKHRMLQIVAEC